MSKLFFQNANFRAFLLFQTCRGIGGGIFSMFMLWMIHATYQNTLYTGMAGFMFAVPFVFSFMVGPLVDRHNKVAIMRLATAVQLAVVGLLLAMPYAFSPGIWLHLLAVLVFETATMFAIPAKTALLPAIVDGDDLLKANALVQIVAIFIGLSIGTFLYFLLAGGSAFHIVYLVNTVVLLVALLFSVLLRSPQNTEAPTVRPRYISELKAGFAFIKQSVAIFLIGFLIAQATFANVAYVNLPMFAERHTGQGSGYIILSAVAMVGGMLGSYLAKTMAPKLEIWKIIAGCLVLAGILRILFVHVIPQDFSRALWIYIAYAGVGSVIGINFQTLMQKLPPKDMVARVDALTTSLFSVISALGALIGGVMGALIANVDTIFIIQGISYIVIGAGICLTKPLRSLPKMHEV